MIRSHVLLCAGTGCTSSGSIKVAEKLEAELKAQGLEEEIKIVKTGCFGLCALGPVMIIYPEGTFYSRVTPEDIPEIVEEHLLKGRIVERLVYADSDDKEVDVKTIIETMLDEMGENLTVYKDKIEKSKYSVHKLLTLASIVELEGASADDRASVAGVFYNRLNDGWSLGSDVTTYYYLKIDDFKQSLNGNKNLLTCDNAYNTRCTSFVGLPVGAVSNPGIESIEATVNYDEHNYYYFVADCKGKTYLNKDATGHYNIINKLKNEGNWCA